MALVEQRGGRFHLQPDGTFRRDVDGVDFGGWSGWTPELVARMVLGLEAEIVALLAEQRRTH